MLQEHWLTPANLDKFSQDFTGCTAFGCSGGSGVFIWGGTGVATLSSGGHTTNTFVLNYRVCNEQMILDKLNKLNITKSPGPDGLHPRIL